MFLFAMSYKFMFAKHWNVEGIFAHEPKRENQIATYSTLAKQLNTHTYIYIFTFWKYKYIHLVKGK